MDKVLAIIPARGGSKGVPGKNTRILKDKPLIAWTIEKLKKSSYINKIVVSTEDSKIKKASLRYGAEVIDRPTELARDDSKAIDAIIYTLNKLKETDYIPDYVILCQCTTPIYSYTEIDKAFLKFKKAENNADFLVSVSKESHPPYWLKKLNPDDTLSDFLEYDKDLLQRRQDFENLYRLNGAFYMGKTQNIIDKNGFTKGKILGYVMDSKYLVDIDTEEDFKYAEFIAENIENL